MISLAICYSLVCARPSRLSSVHYLLKLLCRDFFFRSIRTLGLFVAMLFVLMSFCSSLAYSLRLYRNDVLYDKQRVLESQSYTSLILSIVGRLTSPRFGKSGHSKAVRSN